MSGTCPGVQVHLQPRQSPSGTPQCLMAVHVTYQISGRDTAHMLDNGGASAYETSSLSGEGMGFT